MVEDELSAELHRSLWEFVFFLKKTRKWKRITCGRGLARMRTRRSWGRRTTRWHSALGQTFSWQDYQFAVLWQRLRIFIDWISFLQHTTHIFPYLRISSHCWHIQWPSLCFLMCLSNAASRFWSALVIRPRSSDNNSSSHQWCEREFQYLGI